MLPGLDGLSLLRRLRDQAIGVPVLMLTAKGDPVDRIIGLEQGADDYLAKPFLSRELNARIRSVLRRQSKQSTVAGRTWASAAVNSICSMCWCRTRSDRSRAIA